MDAMEQLLIERECERLVTRYCHYVDHGEAAKIAELFTEDGVWSGPGFELKGLEQVRKGFERRQANKARMSRHVCNNLLIDVVDASNASGTVYLTLYRYDGEEDRTTSPLEGPIIVGEYRDRFVLTDDGWRFARREIETSFMSADAAGG
jgi:uncharacterized protein (TIGR02246 family)